MNLTEYQAIIASRAAAEEEAARLRADLSAARMADPSGAVPRLVDGIRAARQIIPFAMMFIPRDKWPLDALERLAEVYAGLPDATADDAVIAQDWRDYAREARDDLRLRAMAAKAVATTTLSGDS